MGDVNVLLVNPFLNTIATLWVEKCTKRETSYLFQSKKWCKAHVKSKAKQNIWGRIRVSCLSPKKKFITVKYNQRFCFVWDNIDLDYGLWEVDPVETWNKNAPVAAENSTRVPFIQKFLFWISLRQPGNAKLGWKEMKQFRCGGTKCISCNELHFPSRSASIPFSNNQHRCGRIYVSLKCELYLLHIKKTQRRTSVEHLYSWQQLEFQL